MTHHRRGHDPSTGALPSETPSDIGAPGSYRPGGGVVRRGIVTGPVSTRARPSQVVTNPDQVRPPNATYFNAQGVGVSAPGLGVETLVGSFKIPPNYVGVVGNVIFSAQGIVAGSRITFRLKQNGALIQGWDIPLVPQPAAAVSQGYDGDFVRVQMDDGALVEVSVIVDDAGPYTVYAQALGYFYSKAIRAEWEQG